MADDNCAGLYHVLVVIVDNGKGSRVLKLSRQCGIGGGTICLGEGAVGSQMKSWLEITARRKEIVFMVVSDEQLLRTLPQLNKNLKLNKPNHGIAFTIPVSGLYGSRNCGPGSLANERTSEKMQKAIFVIVDRGDAETVIEAAESAGARGATIINARGAGIHETSKLFAMTVEPEKEIVLIITEGARSESIATAVRSATGLDKPGKGILFVVDVDNTMGLY
jgi:nitrogen regulatory protein PII